MSLVDAMPDSQHPVPSGDGDLYDGGGAPLTDLQAEELLLGFVLNTPEAMTEVVEVVDVRDFFDPFHQRIFNCLKRSYQNGESQTYQLNVLGDQMFPGGVTASQYVARLMAAADMSIDPGDVADHLQQCSERRAIGAADDTYFDPRTAVTSKFGLQRWEDIGADSSKQYAWLVENVLPMNEIALVFGDSGTGKTYWTFDLSMSIARLQKFYGRNVEQGLVVYVAAEGGKGGFIKRKMAYAIHHKIPDDAAFPFLLVTKRPNFFSSDDDIVQLIEDIRAMARGYGLKVALIVIDTLSAVSPGMNENASQDVSTVRARLVRLQEAFDTSVILVHHKPKGGTTPRGHGSLTGDFETTIEVEITEKKTSHSEPIYRATARKQREGKPGPIGEFTLATYEIGKNKWGNPETSCVAVPYRNNITAEAPGFRATPTELQFMRALFEAIAEHGIAAPDGLPKSITRAAGVVDVRAAMRTKIIPTDEDSSTADNRFRQAFKRAGDKLRDAGIIGVQSGSIWPTGKPVRGLDNVLGAIPQTEVT